jgi:hypothetical protein
MQGDGHGGKGQDDEIHDGEDAAAVGETGCDPLVSAAEPASRVRTRDLARAMDLLLEGLEKRDTSVTAR